MANVHLLIGEDDFLVAEAAKKRIGEGAFAEVFDSNAASNADLQLKDLVAVDESFSTPPFLEPSKTTWWKNVRFLPQGGKGGPSQEVKEALEKFAAKVAATPPADNQRLVISGPKLLMTSHFAKTLKPVAEIEVFGGGKPWERAKDALGRVAAMADGMGLRFEQGAAELFVARVGADTRSLMGELGKMRDYLGPGANTVTASAIDEVTSQGVGVEPELWAVTDALGERDTGRVVDAARRFEKENAFAVLMTTVVERFFRQLVELKDAVERGREAEATAGMPPFAVRKNLGFLRRWTLRELRVARARFLALREKAVSSGGSIDVLVLAELVRVCRRPRQALAGRKGI